jgi:CO/xanthine dehydrogenase Mo-binding subunit
VVVGQSAFRKEGYDKPTGEERYVDPITIEGMHSDKTVCICIPRGQIKRITLVPRRLNES